MAEELGRMFQRFVVDGATLDFQAEGGIFRRGAKPQTGHVLNLGQGGMHILCSDQVELRVGDKLAVNLHLKGRHSWLKTTAEVRWCRKVPGRPFKRAGLRFQELDAEQLRLVRNLEHDQLPVQAAEIRGQTGRLIENYKLPAETSEPGAKPRSVEAALEAESRRFGLRRKEVQRPVALLELIALLEGFEVNEDLILSVLEAVSQGISVEDLFDLETREEIRPKRRRVIEQKPKEETRVIPVYRLDGKTALHFNEDGVPVTPPVDHVYLSRMAEDALFAAEVQDDRMTQNAGYSFRPGDLLVFSKSAKVENGNFAFVKSKSEADEFAQVFLSRDDQVRLRFLNANHPERMIRRSEVRAMFKLMLRIERIN